ncbi:MAG TPA: rhodanese-like domain-containing protein [Pyrinomonadaceae bacterium]|nr:rhodanese-like domain-containing protein [Pyrinomonadaceae bacterium]
MKLTVLVLATAVTVGLIGLGCSSSQNNVAAAKQATPTQSKPATPAQPTTPTAAPTPVDDAPRISLADAKKAFDDKSAIFVDTHSKQTYDAEHVAGAINMTTGEIGTAADKLPKGKKIIAYCS